jgi:hypothetical protein
MEVRMASCVLASLLATAGAEPAGAVDAGSRVAA